MYVIKYKRETLLKKRSANKIHSPNKWALCAGHVDAGEKLINAMIREAKEEIDLNLVEKEVFPLLYLDLEQGSTPNILHCYYTISNLNEEDFTVQEEELSEVKWVSIKDIIEMIKNNDDSIVFKISFLKYFEEIAKISDTIKEI